MNSAQLSSISFIEVLLWTFRSRLRLLTGVARIGHRISQVEQARTDMNQKNTGETSSVTSGTASNRYHATFSGGIAARAFPKNALCDQGLIGTLRASPGRHSVLIGDRCQ